MNGESFVLVKYEMFLRIKKYQGVHVRKSVCMCSLHMTKTYLLHHQK